MDQVVGRGGLAQVRARGRVERVAPSLEAALNLLHEMAAVTWDRDMAGVELYLDDGDRPLVGIWRSLHGVGCVVLDAGRSDPCLLRGDVSWAVFHDDPPRWVHKKGMFE